MNGPKVYENLKVGDRVTWRSINYNPSGVVERAVLESDMFGIPQSCIPPGGSPFLTRQSHGKVMIGN